MRLFAVLLALCLVQSAWGAILNDDIGDQIVTGTGYDYDLSTMNIEQTPTGTKFTLNFDPASTAGDMSWLGGWIDLDTDQNPNTGRPTHLEDIGRLMTIGVDYYVEFWPYIGMVSLYSGDEIEMGQYPAQIMSAQNAYSFEIPLTLTRFDLAALMSNNGTHVDPIPNTADPYRVDLTPEPTSIALLGLAGGWLVRRKQRCR